MKSSLFVFFCIVLLSLTISGITNQNQALPSISEPDDISYIEGATGNYIEWYVSFDSPLHYSIHRNNTVLNLGSGDLGGSSGNITISVDGRPVGTWYYLLMVDDYADNVALDLVIVTVNPSSFPFLVSVLSVVALISVILVLSVWRIKKS
ncbi:MAG: hypothetical protein ACXAEB_13675 [Candidatus Thorarchaeota archaeon]|jgi:hypothetical protein